MSVSAKLSIIAPQFDADSRRNDFISFATFQVNSDWFGGKYEWAIAYLAAHYMDLNPEGGGSSESSGGFITNKREGDLSISYAKPTGGSSSGGGSSEGLNQTNYGRQFLALRNSSGVILGVTGENEFI